MSSAGLIKLSYANNVGASRLELALGALFIAACGGERHVARDVLVPVWAFFGSGPIPGQIRTPNHCFLFLLFSSFIDLNISQFCRIKKISHEFNFFFPPKTYLTLPNFMSYPVEKEFVINYK